MFESAELTLPMMLLERDVGIYLFYWLSVGQTHMRYGQPETTQPPLR